MSFYNKVRQDSKLDSRRFGKSVTCKIVYGPLLEFMYQKNLIPPGVFCDSGTGLNPVNNKIILIPVTKHKYISSLINNFPGVKGTEEISLEQVENLILQNESLIKAIQQNMIVATISNYKPNGKEAGADPKVYDVIVDSLDVNKAVEGYYVYTTNPKINRGYNLNDPA